MIPLQNYHLLHLIQCQIQRIPLTKSQHQSHPKRQNSKEIVKHVVEQITMPLNVIS